MEDLSQELHKNLSSGAAINISGYLRDFEYHSLFSTPTTASLIFHLFSCYLTDELQNARLL